MNPPLTIKGDAVKSYGEMDIANFLYQNGIEYTYEKEYAFDTRTEDRNQYYPDFYLNDYNIYIEYFGIDEKGNVPVYFRHSAEKSATMEYMEGILWKRTIHRQNNTVMIECFSYERSHGILLTRLEEKLKAHGVVFAPKSTEEIWANITSNNRNVIQGLAELMSTLINLIKSNDLKLDDVEKLSSHRNVVHSKVILKMLKPIYDSYQSELTMNGEIDFNDMINRAASLVNEGKYTNPYKCVLIDEYQDISKARFRLLKELRISSDYVLFCVGDDWQSIYRFTGSDMDFIINFDKYWGASEHSKVETTYRFNDSLIDISGRFIMQNRSQIKKQLKGMYHAQRFALGIVSGYNEKRTVESMLERLGELPRGSSVFFIGRYNFDVDLIKNCRSFDCKYNLSNEDIQITYGKRRDLRIRFITAHRSKGLQADYVFIINNKDRGMGFPSKIKDDPLVDILLQAKEDFPYAEERRLFYVAMTRAKEKTFLVVVGNNKSVFVQELESRYMDKLNEEGYLCPDCGGYLIKKKGPYGDFYGCSNYRTLGCKFTKKIERKEGS